MADRKMKLTVRLDMDLYSKLKELAADKDITMTETVKRLILEAYIRRDQGGK